MPYFLRSEHYTPGAGAHHAVGGPLHLIRPTAPRDRQVQGLPGRLLHTNVAGCAIFAAVSGSSAATCATIGKITLPELARRAKAGVA